MLILYSTITENYIFIFSFCVIFAITYIVLLASRLENCFKQAKLWQIRVAYILICTVFGYLIADFLVVIGEILGSNFFFF